MEVFEYIKQYCANRGITRYDVRSKVLTKKDFALPHTFAPGIAFFYRFCATGTINNIADITEFDNFLIKFACFFSNAIDKFS